MTFTKTLTIAAFIIAASPLASAQDKILPQTDAPAELLVTILADDITDAQAIFDDPLKINVASIEATSATNDITGNDIVYSDEPQLTYEVTDKAFIGVADIKETEQVNGNKGGFPEGRYIEPFNSVAGGGIRTTF